MITEVEAYFASVCGRCKRFATPDCSARLWSDALAGLPEELARALHDDPDLAEAFNGLTRGRQRSCVIRSASPRSPSPAAPESSTERARRRGEDRAGCRVGSLPTARPVPRRPHSPDASGSRSS